MRRGSLFTRAKKATAIGLAAVMVFIAMPAQNVKAAEKSPYVISQGRMIYASSSVGNSDPAYAIDGSKSTRWESAWENSEEWIYVDLGKITNFTGVKLYWEGAYAKEYKIQISNDEENWNTVYTNNNCNGGNEELKIQGNARYVRLNMTKKALTAYGYSLYEFEVYGTDGVTKRPVDYGINIAENKSVQASSLRDVWWMYDDNGVINQTSVLAKNAVDGSDNTYWCSGESDKQWFMVDLGRNYDIGRVVIDWNSDAGKMYDIQVSTNGNDWTTVYRQLKGYGYEVADVPMFATARYVRMNGYTRVESGSGFSIKEFKVYEYKPGDTRPTYRIPSLPESYVASNGKGTYLANSMYNEKTKLPVYKDESIKSPIDSNDWWQSILINRFGNTLCTMPFKTKYSAKGLGILTATEGWLPDMGETDVNVSVNTETETDFYILPENLDNASACDKVMDYSDYSVTAGLYDDSHLAMKSTFVKGSPYIFTEYGDTETIYISSSGITSIFDGNGNEILINNLATLKTDHIGLEITDNDNKAKTKTSKSYYVLSVPENTTFKKIGSYIRVTFPGKNGYMSIGTMLNKSQIETFYRHGYAFVTDTNVTYDYNDSNAKITSNYSVTTTVKRAGFSNQTFQCMLPHQWKNSTDDNASFATYTSVRGDMKAIEGNSFKTVSEFAGLLPTFALPTGSDFDGEALLGYLNQLEDATKNLNPSVDGGKIADNDTSTRWSSGFTDNEWAQIDLGKSYTINKVALNWEASYAKAYKLQTSSDGNNWNTVYETSNCKGGREEIVFDATTCRYVRMQGVKRALAYGYSLWEMGVYEAGTVQNPQFSLASGTYNGTQYLTINSPTKGVEIRYTTDGSTPNENSKLYVPTVKINKDTTMKAIAYRKGMITSGVSTAAYKINGGSTEEPGDVVTGENLAKNKRVTASGEENGAMKVENVIDGNNGTRWSSDFVDDAWMTVDLGKTYTISKVVLNWEGAYGKAYKIQTSTDGKNWATVKNVTDGKGGVETITFTATDTRYVKMQGVTRALPYGYSIWEMEVYGKGSAGESEEPDVSGENVAKGATADASGVEADGTLAKYAIDGNNGTRWSSNFADDAWICVDLGKSYTINKVVLNWEGAYGESYKIQTSTDGKTWKTVKSLTGQNGGIDTVVFDAVSARYVKMQGVKRALPYGYSLWEMEVYTK